MAEDFIDAIYENAFLITKFKMMEEYCHEGKFRSAKILWADNLEIIAQLCRDITVINQNVGIQLWDNCQKVRECMQNLRYSEAGDTIENIIPLLYTALSFNGKIDVTDNNYRLFSTESGFLNIEHIGNNTVFYSCVDPVWEQRRRAKALYNPNMRRVCILGCGLGYLAWQMYEVSNQSIDVFLYEDDENMIDYARNYGVLDRIPKEKLHIIVHNDINVLLDKFSDNFDDYNKSYAVLYINQFYMLKLNNRQAFAMDELISMIYTGVEFNDISEQNFYRNHSNVKADINEIGLNKCPKQWIVVAGGPSLDDNIDYLRQQLGTKTIICASTSYGRLLAAGIKPDFMVVMDPQNRTYGHLDNIEGHDTPLIMADTANWQFGEKYKGRKYLVNISGHHYSLDYSERKWYSQGTVTAFAIDVAIYGGAEEIELIGVDLAYPTLYSHAKGTMDNKKVDTSLMVKVESVNGNNVYTSELFKSYISDIEDQIEQHPQIKFFNLSRNGAMIKGCKNRNV